MAPFMVLQLPPPLNMFIETAETRMQSNRQIVGAPTEMQGYMVELVKKAVGE
jgi:hypothetical protein